MPFSYVDRFVAILFQSLCYSDVPFVEPLRPFGGFHLGIRAVLASNEIGESQFSRVHTRHDARACGRANRTGRIGIGKRHPF